MPAREPKDEALRLYACLLYVRDRDTTITDIAQHVGRDRTTVTRWLIEAEREKKWIDRSPRLTLGPRELLVLSREAHDGEKGARLLELLRTGDSPLREVLVPYIVPPLEQPPDHDALADRLRDVTGRAAAHYVNGLISEDQEHVQLGITWGKSLEWTVRHIEAIARNSIPELTTLPLIGNLEILGKRRGEFVSAEAGVLASRLTRAYRGVEAGYLSVPAFLPRPQRKSDRAPRILRDYFESTPFYHDTFGSNTHPGRIWNTRICIIGIGSVMVPAWPRRTGHIRDQDIKALAEAGAVGDIAGQFFTAEGLHPPDSCDCPICRTNNRVLGVTLRTLAALARNQGPAADASPHPNFKRHVIAVASGRKKAPAIIAACRLCVTDLIVDEDTADEMLKVLDPEDKTGGAARERAGKQVRKDAKRQPGGRGRG